METKGSAAEQLYEAICLRGLEPEHLYPTSEIEAILGRSIQRSRSAVYGAARRLERFKRRTLVCVVGVGYKIAHPRDVPQVALDRLRRGRRQISRGKRTVDSQDVSVLTQQERQEGDLVRAGMLFLGRQMKRMDEQLQRHDERIGRLEEDHERLRRLEEELRRLRAEQQSKDQ